MSDDTPLLVSVREGSRLAGISRDFAYELVRAGTWPTVAVGRRRLVPRQAIAAWAERIARGEPAEKRTSRPVEAARSTVTREDDDAQST